MLASGPGNVGAALGVDRALNGVDLVDGVVRVEPRRGAAPPTSRGPRVGVEYAGDWAARRLRFWITDDPHRSGR
jgi:DNA-3-methyladenine glycosylase